MDKKSINFAKNANFDSYFICNLSKPDTIILTQ
jgi:hypothetical protein